MKQVTHFGFNRTDAGHYLRPTGWTPVEQAPRPWREWLQHLVEHQRRLCRIWVRFNTGEQACVYWYEQGELTLPEGAV
jgi:hypothetical protein